MAHWAILFHVVQRIPFQDRTEAMELFLLRVFWLCMEEMPQANVLVFQILAGLVQKLDCPEVCLNLFRHCFPSVFEFFVSEADCRVRILDFIFLVTRMKSCTANLVLESGIIEFCLGLIVEGREEAESSFLWSILSNSLSFEGVADLLINSNCLDICSQTLSNGSMSDKTHVFNFAASLLKSHSDALVAHPDLLLQLLELLPSLKHSEIQNFFANFAFSNASLSSAVQDSLNALCESGELPESFITASSPS
jgi:hypothetical protein